jgi:peptidoglycan hydrolase-like protein with peptidoglycan-binding domain
VGFSFSRQNEGEVLEHVKALQSALIARGFDLGTMGADGKFGSRTEKAVREYQKFVGLPETGVVEMITWNHLAQEFPSILGIAFDDPGLPHDPAILYADDTPPDPYAPVVGPEIWFTKPLPISANERFLAALADLEQKINTSADPRDWRYKCWIGKLENPSCDDRMIEWDRIYPNVGGAPLVIGARDLAGPSPIGEDTIYNSIRSISDVDLNGDSISLFTHMKSAILQTFEQYGPGVALENLRGDHDRIIKAIEKLDFWANLPLGGSSAMPVYYVSIKDWIGRNQNNPLSLYSCR